MELCMLLARSSASRLDENLQFERDLERTATEHFSSRNEEKFDGVWVFKLVCGDRFLCKFNLLLVGCFC